MDYNVFANLEYCKEIVDGLHSFLLYTHIPPAVLSLLLGIYVLTKNKRDLSARYLFGLAIIFSLWVTDDLAIWLLYDRASSLMFLWSVMPILTFLLCQLTFYFTYTFQYEKNPPIWVSVIWSLLIIPIIVSVPTTFNLVSFDARNCVATEGTWFLYYYHSIGLLTAIALPLIKVIGRKKNLEKKKSKGAVTFSVWGAVLFIITFFITSFLSSYLVDAGIVPDFGLEQYGILAMSLFMSFLTYTMVQYGAFDGKLLAAQALVIGLVILIASQFLFVTDTIAYWLVALTLGLSAFFGIMLVRSVRKEIEQRQKIELLAKNLEQANDAQVILIHFITHQIKGFVAKSRNIFSMALEGDFGPVGAKLKPMLQAGFDSDTKGATVIQEILNAANIKSGKVTYTMEPFDLRPLIEDMVNYHNASAKEKGVDVHMELGTQPVRVLGDRAQLMNVFKNVIDNSIKYTPKGEVNISLTSKPEKKVVLFAIKDTGVGITPEDMQNLFTEGGHGKDSIKVNVESTGFGLYIVKQIVDAHKGRVWAESEGAGKGTQFYIELPSA